MIIFENLVNRLNQILAKMRVNDIRVVSKDVLGFVTKILINLITYVELITGTLLLKNWGFYFI